MVAVTLIAGFFLLFPQDLEKLARSAVAQQLMLSNVYFWQNVGYFDGPSELRPLLHTWSLAVEEQFYLGFPFLMLVGRRMKKRRFASLLCCLALASFVVSEWGCRAHPSGSFFLLPSRAWELLLGAILVFCPAPTRLRPWHCNLMSWAGVGGILLAAICYDSSTRFLGATALLPCLGTALVVYSNAFKPTIVGRLLSTKALVSLGLMSYSLYLWHWPILAFERYWLGETLAPTSCAVALSSSLVLAYVSWKFVEMPFRRGGYFKSGKKVVYGAFSCFVCLIAISLWVSNEQGFPNRVPANVLRFAQGNSLPQGYTTSTTLVRQGTLPQLGSLTHPEKDIAFLIWGDSHAVAVAGLCDTLAREHGIRGCMAARPATIPLLGTWRQWKRDETVEWNQAVLEFVKSRNISNVIMISRWAVNIEGRPNGKLDSLIVDAHSTNLCPEESKAVLRRGLERTLAALQAQGVRVWIMKQVPLQAGNPARSLVMAALQGHTPPAGVHITVHERRQANVNDVLDSSCWRDVIVLDPKDYCFAPSGNSLIGDTERSFYADDDHLSEHGAEILLRPLLEPMFDDIARYHEEDARRAGRPKPSSTY